MDKLNQNTTQHPEYKFRSDIDFEQYFKKEIISSEKIQFARHYIENKMGYDLDEDSLIDFSAIGIKLFGCMVADIVLEYENFSKQGLDG